MPGCSAGRERPTLSVGTITCDLEEKHRYPLGTHGQLVEEEEGEADARAQTLKFDCDNRPGELDSPTGWESPSPEPPCLQVTQLPLCVHPAVVPGHFLTTWASLLWETGVLWVELCPPDSCIQVLTPRTSRWDLVWRWTFTEAIKLK